jgi:hypothetical protein
MTGNMQCFSYLQTVEKSFFEEKNVEKCHFSYLYRPLPYSSRDGENMLSSCPSARQNNPKNPRAPAGTGASAKLRAQYSN